jgi:hypothetical protein
MLQKGEYCSENTKISFLNLFVFDDPQEELIDFRIQVCEAKGRHLTLRCNAVIDIGFKIEQICRGEH